MALLTPLDASVAEVRDVLATARNDFAVALHTADNPFAIGAVIRVAHSFLAREIILVGAGTWYEKASMGMEKYEDVTRVADEAALLTHLAGRPLWAIEKDTAKTNLYAVHEFPRNVVFLFGSERFGIPHQLCARADAAVGIPVYGINHSLPLAVAAGIVMSEWARRHYTAGVAIGDTRRCSA